MLGALVVSGCPSTPATAPEPVFELQVGDLLFQDLDCGPICDAIESVTHGVSGANLSHVAMVSRVDSKQVWVIEAYAKGVVEVPLDELLARSHDAAGNPKVLVGRLRAAYLPLVPRVLQAARRRLGKPYDEAFAVDNDKYYCSELLYEGFVEANDGRPVFELQPMTFRDPKTGKTAHVWQSYFEELGQPIPEGQPGLNPGGMSSSDVLTIVHAFGSPKGWRPSSRSSTEHVESIPQST
jgi:Permuted papain-like amidase enzyme, YaeF/YiiX, C92 family